MRQRNLAARWLALFFLAGLAGCANISRPATMAAAYHLPRPVAYCQQAHSFFRAHVAATHSTRRIGFAGASPATIAKHALLFLFPAQMHTFNARHFRLGADAPAAQWQSVHWAFNMRNMNAALDIIFMTAHGRVLSIVRRTPDSPDYTPPHAYTAVLEMAAGRARTLGITPGVTLQCNAAGGE